MNKPDFFIVGAPKCGTTALYTYLKDHPEIGMSRVKEPHFFAPERGPQRRSATMAHYLSLFEDATGKRRIGEASTGYLASVRAPQEILEFNGNAQIVVMLRNPVDLLHSLHSHRVFDGSEHITEFALAVNAREPRYWKYGPSRGKRFLGSDYRETTRFSEQIGRYHKAFGRDRVHVILFDDFARAPGIEYGKVLTFLGLRSDGRHDFEIVNANKRPRSSRAQHAMRHLHGQIRRIEDWFPGFFRMARTMAKDLNYVYEPRRPMEAGFRRQLEMEYVPEIRNLERVLGLSLSQWLGPPAPAARNIEGDAAEFLQDPLPVAPDCGVILDDHSIVTR